MKPARACIGLGANLGDARATLQAARDALAALPGCTLVACSSWWRSAPIDARGPDFVNGVVALDTTLAPLALLDALQAIEQQHGRERPYRNAPRTLDLDLLLYGDESIAEVRLTVPHPRMLQRAFVVRPLLEIAPELTVPGFGPLAAALPALQDQDVQRLAPLDRFRHIAIEGPIGVGKSTLARRLASHLNAHLLLERPEDNPFLERFYADRKRYAMQTQLAFLFQRVEQYRELTQPGMFGAPRIVSDFIFDKDALFARLTLSDDEYRLYAQIHAQTAPLVPRPDLVIWLQADTETLLQRVQRRGLAMERSIDAEYLQRLSDAYAEYFERQPAMPLLAVDTTAFNPAFDDADFSRLIERLAGFRGPREGFETQAGE